MKTIVIPDIHQNIRLVDAVLAKEKHFDEVVFLGDWFDSFHQPPQVAYFPDTCRYLRNLILEHPERKKFVFLLGNHDISYIYHNNHASYRPVEHTDCYFCSGFTRLKAIMFRQEFFDEGLGDSFFMQHFRPAHFSQGVALSHAGFHRAHLKPGETLQDLINNRLPNIWRRFRHYRTPGNWLLSAAGYARQGDSEIGGLLWLDWRQEFPIHPNLGPQILGHTSVYEPECRGFGTAYECWNIDTGKDYAIIRDGRITTAPIPRP